MKKRTLTVEQIASRDARRAKFRALAKRVAAMSDGERARLLASMPAIVTIEGRALSPFNSCLVMLQNPRASIVGGFRQWIKHGRAVKKGEHGASIWVPCAARVVDGAADDGDGKPGFIAGTVFDVTQTAEIAAGDKPDDVIEVPAIARGFDGPIAVVTPEVADAFGMRGLPNVRIEESDGPVFDGWICTKPSDEDRAVASMTPAARVKAATIAEHYEHAETLTLEN